jgi:para-nitrobenzyl esterase
VREAPSPKPLGWYLSSRQTGCWNWEQATIRSSAEGSAHECGLRCQLDGGCTGFGFRSTDCAEQDAGGQGACVLLEGECSMKPDTCYDFYQMGAEPIVNVSSGSLRGLEIGGVAGFHGVPYARPPTGERRFASPEPADAWGPGPLVATKGARKCPQALDWYGVDPDDQAEDCLYLNVYAPVHSLGRDALLPIMVWFHGGSFAAGRPDGMWNITRLTGIVGVEPQYRLSALGFFASKAPPSNFGLEDQRLALKWVQQNARAFGGDPDRVMMFGNSAGGASVAAHLVMPESFGLFSSASLESPGGRLGWMGSGMRINDDFLVASLLMDNSRRLAEELDCAGPDDMDCLRGAPVEKLMSVASEMRFAPALAVEGEFPLALIQRGEWQQVPVIVGATSCESCLIAEAAFGPPSADISEENFRGALEQLVNAGGSEVISAEELEDWYRDRVAEEGMWRAFARIDGDSGHTCNAVLTSEALRATSPKVWRYHFDLLDPEFGDDMPGAPHAAELLWLLAQKNGTLARAMASWWASFAANGDPNVGSVSNLTWPKHSAEEPLVLFLDEEPHVGNPPDTAECSHWRRFFGGDEDITE